MLIISRAFCKYDSKLKVKHKTNLLFFLKNFICPIHPKSSQYLRKCHYYLFFFVRNWYFTLSSSSPSSIYKIVIVINTPTTMNNQFEALNATKINFHSCYLLSYELKTTFFFHFLSLFFQRKPRF